MAANTSRTWSVALDTHSSLASSFFGSGGILIVSIDEASFANLMESAPMSSVAKIRRFS